MMAILISAHPGSAVHTRRRGRSQQARNLHAVEHEAAEEGQIDAARRPQQRVEVVNRIETAKPGAGTVAKRSEGASMTLLPSLSESSVQERVHSGYG
jgi:hypothetical protein